MSLHRLRDDVKSRIVEKSDSGVALMFESFGFKNGVPADADMVYDVRCLPNPYWDNSLRSLSGLDVAVQAFLDSQPQAQEMFEDIRNYLQKWIPRFEENNRSYITVAIGCTGGQHRSVYLCEKLKDSFSAAIKNVQVRHRELNS